MEPKKYCIILKNGAEINITTDRMVIMRGNRIIRLMNRILTGIITMTTVETNGVDSDALKVGRISGIDIDDPAGFVQYINAREIVAVLAYPAIPTTEMGNSNG